MDVSVSVVGLGKLGACMAVAMASRGVRTIGADVNSDVVDKVRRNLAPVFEPGLTEMMSTHDNLLSATTDIEAAVRETDITFVVVPTPSNDRGAFSLQYVGAAMEKIGYALQDARRYHSIVLTSTVVPGSTEYFVRPLLEATSGKQCGPGFGLCYSPEFIALGSVIRDFLNPDFLLVGECDSLAGDRLETFYRKTLQINAPTSRMSPVNAEVAKIALNTFITTKVTFANLLAEICEQLPGGDVDAVTSALGLDRRIGPKYLKGALGYGGPCFPRDNGALGSLLDELGSSAELPRLVDTINRRQPARLAAMIERLELNGSRRVAVLGLAYKPHTNVIEESQGVAIARLLAQKEFNVSVYDPVAMEAAKGVLGDEVEYAVSMADCVRGAEVIVVATEWEEFHSLAHGLAHLKPCPVIVDGWRMLRSFPGMDEFPYRAIGLGQQLPDTRERLRRFVETLAKPGSRVEQNEAPGSRTSVPQPTARALGISK